jgi:hypothetical protein
MEEHFEKIARIVDNATPVTEPQAKGDSKTDETPRRRRSRSQAAINGPSQSRKLPPSDPPTDAGSAIDRRLAGFPLTDLGNAERFVERFGHRFKWCPAIGWLAWDGGRWTRPRACLIVLSTK